MLFSWKYSTLQKKYTNTQIHKYTTSHYTNTQVLKNEPYKDVPLLNGKFTEGQYTHKIYHLASKVAIVVFLIIISMAIIMAIIITIFIVISSADKSIWAGAKLDQDGRSYWLT